MNESKDAYMRAIQIDVDIPEAWLNIGFIFESCNNTNEAMMLYKDGLDRTNSPAIASALNNIMSGIRGSTALVKVNDERIFNDIPNKYAMEYVSSSPMLQSSDIGIDIDISVISTFPVSPLLK